MGDSLSLGLECRDAGVKEASEGDFTTLEEVRDGLLLSTALDSLGASVHLSELLAINSLPALGEALVGDDESLVCGTHT